MKNNVVIGIIMLLLGTFSVSACTSTSMELYALSDFLITRFSHG